MSYSVPCATVTVDEPRHLGALTKFGWCGDIIPQPPGLPYALYQYADTEYLPELKAIAPAGRVAREDMLFANWQILSGQWDDKARPATAPRTRFLHAYGGAAGAVSKVQSVASYTPNWCGWFYRYVPPSSTAASAVCDFSVKMLGDGSPEWRIVIPTRNEGNKFPRLLRAAASGLPAYEMSRCDVDTTSSQDAGWQEYVIWCEQVLNSWIIVIRANGNVTRWHYTYPGTDVADTTVSLCGDGPLQVQSQGQQLMFAVAPITYPWFSEAFLRTYYAIHADLADLTDVDQQPTGQGVIIAPTGSKAYVTVDTSGNSLAPRITFLNSATTRALCGVVSVIVPPKFDPVSHDDAWTTAANSAVSFREGDTITYLRRSSWRGNEFTLPLRDPTGAFDWKGNEVATLSLGYQTTADAPTLAAWVTGYVEGLERDRNSPVDMNLPLSVRDFFGSRMKHKSMIYMPSFCRMTFADAFDIIARRIGFSAVQTDLDGTLGAMVLPGPQVLGEQSLYWGAEANPEEALDTLAQCVGGFIGIDASGKLFAKPLATYSSADYTLDSDTTTAGDYVRHILYQRDLEDLANNCFVITGSDGYRQVGWARDSASEATASAGDFIGDQFVSVEVLENTFASAATLATRSLATRSRFSEVIQWTPVQAKTALAPGKFVKVQIENMQIATDSIYYITEERGTIMPTLRDAGGWQQEFTMVRYQ